jgi:hypothetical protein
MNEQLANAMNSPWNDLTEIVLLDNIALSDLNLIMEARMSVKGQFQEIDFCLLQSAVVFSPNTT